MCARLPLRDRKRLLRATLQLTHDTLRLSTHRNGDGEAYFRHACAHGWEGLVAKRADSPYVARRSRDWLKLKCEQGQELVIGGYTAPRVRAATSARCCSATTRMVRCAMPARSGPALTRRRCARSGAACAG